MPRHPDGRRTRRYRQQSVISSRKGLVPVRLPTLELLCGCCQRRHSGANRWEPSGLGRWSLLLLWLWAWVVRPLPVRAIAVAATATAIVAARAVLHSQATLQSRMGVATATAVEETLNRADATATQALQ